MIGIFIFTNAIAEWVLISVVLKFSVIDITMHS